MGESLDCIPFDETFVGNGITTFRDKTSVGSYITDANTTFQKFECHEFQYPVYVGSNPSFVNEPIDRIYCEDGEWKVPDGLERIECKAGECPDLGNVDVEASCRRQNSLCDEQESCPCAYQTLQCRKDPWLLAPMIQLSPRRAISNTISGGIISIFQLEQCHASE